MSRRPRPIDIYKFNHPDKLPKAPLHYLDLEFQTRNIVMNKDDRYIVEYVEYLSYHEEGENFIIIDLSFFFVGHAQKPKQIGLFTRVNGKDFNSGYDGPTENIAERQHVDPMDQYDIQDRKVHFDEHLSKYKRRLAYKLHFEQLHFPTLQPFLENR